MNPSRSRSRSPRRRLTTRRNPRTPASRKTTPCPISMIWCWRPRRRPFRPICSRASRPARRGGESRRVTESPAPSRSPNTWTPDRGARGNAQRRQIEPCRDVARGGPMAARSWRREPGRRRESIADQAGRFPHRALPSAARRNDDLRSRRFRLVGNAAAGGGEGRDRIAARRLLHPARQRRAGRFPRSRRRNRVAADPLDGEGPPRLGGIACGRGHAHRERP